MLTDPNGEYHFDDLPIFGSFVISAEAPQSKKPPESSDDQPLIWARTYYPGVTDPEAAARIAMPPSGGLWNLDIKLAAVPSRRIRGVVLDPEGHPVPKVDLMLGGTMPQRATSKDDGTFEFGSATDGRWPLSATISRTDVTLKAQQTVEINGHDLADVKLRLAAPFSIHGSVAVGVPEGSPVPKLPRISLNPVINRDGPGNFVVGNQSVDPDGTGKFVIENLYPGPYIVRPGSPPAGYYLDSIRLGNGDASGDPPIEILSGNQPLTITYKQGGGTVRGTIESCSGGTVLLIPQDPASLSVPNFIRKTPCAFDGQFEFQAVRPGKYYGLAIPPDDPARSYIKFSDDLLTQSVAVTVGDNETVAAEIHLLKRW